MCHVAGWPIPRGGAQNITNALVRHLQSLGGEVGRQSGGDQHRHAAARQGHPVRSLAEAAAADRGPPVSGGVSTQARAVSLRHGRVQSGLGARGADSLEGRRMPARRHRSSRWHVRRDRRVGTGRVGRTNRRPAVRAPQPADAVRSVARARRQACGVGLLPRAGRHRP